MLIIGDINIGVALDLCVCVQCIEHTFLRF